MTLVTKGDSAANLLAALVVSDCLLTIQPYAKNCLCVCLSGHETDEEIKDDEGSQSGRVGVECTQRHVTVLQN
jgi:hypothetical protein